MTARKSSGRGGSRRTPQRKTLQLCKQVQRSLSYALGSQGDSVLGGLLVDSVVPGPDASRLLVTVCPLDADLEPTAIIARIGAALPQLRAEVARDIHRKRVPELAFQCRLPAEPTPSPPPTSPLPSDDADPAP